jgi:hypothetical protein
MASIPNLIEDLRVLMLDPPWNSFFRLLRMLDSVANSPELETLTNDELRAVKGFRITMYRAVDMEADTMLKHVAAHWLGTVDQAIRKLSIGPQAVACFGSMMDCPASGSAYGTLT